MKVYSVHTDDTMTFATKREAVAYAKAQAQTAANGNDYSATSWGPTIAVEEVTLVPMTKEAIVQLINNGGRYIADSRVVFTVPNPVHDETPVVKGPIKIKPAYVVKHAYVESAVTNRCAVCGNARGTTVHA